jgi:hypothetical protein
MLVALTRAIWLTTLQVIHVDGLSGTKDVGWAHDEHLDYGHFFLVP